MPLPPTNGALNSRHRQTEGTGNRRGRFIAGTGEQGTPKAEGIGQPLAGNRLPEIVGADKQNADRQSGGKQNAGLERTCAPTGR